MPKVFCKWCGIFKHDADYVVNADELVRSHEAICPKNPNVRPVDLEVEIANSRKILNNVPMSIHQWSQVSKEFARLADIARRQQAPVATEEDRMLCADFLSRVFWAKDSHYHTKILELFRKFGLITEGVK